MSIVMIKNIVADANIFLVEPFSCLPFFLGAHIASSRVIAIRLIASSWVSAMRLIACSQVSAKNVFSV